ncbi:MAG: response regulator transcription factor [Anaerolineae bacterium]|nr:response regulator transcription factor [Anaerolineae bacterium]
MLSSSSAESVAANPQRILVVDDDPAIVRLVRDKLDYTGFEVLVATSGQQALEIIERRGLPHLAIVDVMMPGMDGFEFCRIVQQFSDLPVIMLTAVDEEETVIRGLEYFAEDYVTKPFSPRELVARVRRVLRRMGDFAYTLDRMTRVDDHLAVDFTHQQALVDGQPVAFTPLETKLLYILMRNAGQTVTTDFLLRRLWPREEVLEDALRVHIHRLRQKIETTPAHPQYIVTERGVGYSFPLSPPEKENLFK